MNVALDNNDRSCRLGNLLADYVLPASLAATNIQLVTCDSRAVEQGSLFVAVPGQIHDGRQFIDDAVRAGASAVVCEDSQAMVEASISWRNDIPVIGVGNVLLALGRIAAAFYGQPDRSLTVTGVTGTNGKSTCVALLAQLQQLLGTKAGVIGTLGYGPVGEKLTVTGMTTPDAISCQRILRELADRQVKAVAMEVSSHGLIQERVTGVDIGTALFTNLTRDHLDYHSDMNAYAEAKARLFALPSVRHAVVNIDDSFAQIMVQALQPGAQLWTYSLRDPSAEVYASRVEFLPEGMKAFVRTPWGSGDVHTALLGEFNLYNVLAVITAACAEGADFKVVLGLVPELKPVAGRMQKIDSAADVQAVVDYAHTPDALRQALAALRLHGKHNIHLVFGCGGDRDKGKRAQMAVVAEMGADHVVVTSDNPRTESPAAIISDILAGFSQRQKVDAFEDRAEAIASTIASAAPGDIVLIAGKGHEDYQLLGTRKLPFDDAAHARLALQKRARKENE